MLDSSKGIITVPNKSGSNQPKTSCAGELERDVQQQLPDRDSKETTKNKNLSQILNTGPAKVQLAHLGRTRSLCIVYSAGNLPMKGKDVNEGVGDDVKNDHIDVVKKI